MKLSEIKAAAKHYPLAPRKTAVRQAARLVQAHQYLEEHSLTAIGVDSKFKYARATGSVLGNRS